MTHLCYEIDLKFPLINNKKVWFIYTMSSRDVCPIHTSCGKSKLL